MSGQPFRLLANANLLAQAAEQLSLTAAPLIAVLMLSAGAGEIGLLASVQTLPFFLLAMPAGLLADRYSRRRLMVVSETVRVVSLIGLAVLPWTPWLSIASLASLGFLGALGTVGFSVAAPALVPALVPSGELASANARLELARSAAYAAGPAFAGALVSWAGATTAFVTALVLSTAALAMLLRIVEPYRSAAPARHPITELRDGVLQVWSDPLLRPVLLTAIAWNTSWFVLQAAYLPYAVRSMALSASAVGATLSAYGVGMVAGALLASRLLARIPFGHAIALGPVVSVVAAALMVATTVWPSGWLAGASFFLFGAGPIIWTITSVTLRQTITPKAMLGRVSALFLTVTMGVRSLGAALGGLVGAYWGEAACLYLAFAGFLLQAAVIVWSPTRPLRTLPAAIE